MVRTVRVSPTTILFALKFRPFRIFIILINKTLLCRINTKKNQPNLPKTNSKPKTFYKDTPPRILLISVISNNWSILRRSLWRLFVFESHVMTSLCGNGSKAQDFSPITISWNSNKQAFSRCSTTILSFIDCNEINNYF